MQRKELTGKRDGTGHGAVTMLGEPGSLGRQKSSCCRPCREHVRRHTCGRQGRPRQMVAPDLWSCESAPRDRGAFSMDDGREKLEGE